MPLEEIRREVHGLWMTPGLDVAVEGVSIDSRTARQGELFVAIRGERLDGHEFLADAAKAGCVAAIVARDAPLLAHAAGLFGGGLIAVADTTRALGELAGFVRRRASATGIAVTGSNGKTTVKEMIHHILARRMTGSCSPRSYNNQIGVPLTLLAVAPGDDYVICEVGSSAPGEIAALSGIIRPQIAVITSVGPTHLEKLGSVESVAVEKASILGSLTEDGLGVVSADSDVLGKALLAYEKRIITFGVSDSSQLRLTGCEPRGHGQRFEVNGRLWVPLGVPGRHNALNALAAIAVAQRMGIDQGEAAEALSDFQGAEMRLQWVEAPGLTLINDAYNCNPASLLAAAEVLGDQPGRRRVLVVGDMLELGDQGEALHVRAGRDIASHRVDLLIGVGPLGRYIARGAAEAGLTAEEVSSVRAARGTVPELLRRGDVVLVKGSRGVAMDRLIEPIRAKYARPARRKKSRAGKTKGRSR